MAKFATTNIRTLALVGHGASGKTTLVEALLHKAGSIQSVGRVERGTTVSDFEPLEASLAALAAVVGASPRDAGHARAHHRHARISRLHRPIDRRARRGRDRGGRHQRGGGHRNDRVAHDGLGGRAEALPAADRQQDRCRERRSCRRLLDRDPRAFGKECLPINLPVGQREARRRLFFQSCRRGGFFVGRRCAPRAGRPGRGGRRGADVALPRARRDLAPSSCMRHSKRRCARAISYRCASCRREMASASRSCSTSSSSCCRIPPREIRRLFTKGEGENAVEFRSEPDPKKHVLAHVFKVVMDPFVGKLGVFRVHQGTVTRDTQLFVGDGRKPFKVGHLFMLQGGKNVEVDGAVPGDIAAVAKVDEIEFDCVLHDSHDEDHIHMQPLDFPTPMQGVALTPKKRGDEQRIWEVLHRMTAEDPTLVVEHDPQQQRDGAPGAGRAASALGARAHVDPVQARDRDPAAAHSRIARRSPRRPMASIGTRSRPAGPASSARCRCASSRWRAARASNSSTRPRAA